MEQETREALEMCQNLIGVLKDTVAALSNVIYKLQAAQWHNIPPQPLTSIPNPYQFGYNTCTSEAAVD